MCEECCFLSLGETVLVNGLSIVNLINRLIDNYYGGKIIECFIHMEQWVAHDNLPWIDAVPHDEAKSNDYFHLIYNYRIDSDTLSEAVYNGLAVRIGSEILELDYAENVAGVSINVHIMVNFYQHFK
jgi:hypothetical protein